MDNHEVPQDPRSILNPYRMEMSPNYMTAQDRLSKRLSSLPMSHATPRKRTDPYIPPKVTTVEEVWMTQYKQTIETFPVINSTSTVEEIRKCCLHSMAILEFIVWIGRIDETDQLIIYEVLLVLEYITGIVDTDASNSSKEVLELHSDLVGIINLCRGINGRQDWYGNGLYGWKEEYSWSLSSEEALGYLDDMLSQWHPRRRGWRRERKMEPNGAKTSKSSSDAVLSHLKQIEELERAQNLYGKHH